MTEQLSEEAEAEVLTGLLTFTVNGTERHVPELKWRANREWQAAMNAKFKELVGVRPDTPDGLRDMADAERELVLAYDTTGALGDLEDATEREIDIIYDKLVTVAFPLASSQTAVGLAIVRAVIESARESSTSGPSPTGTSGARTRSKQRSPSGRSPSSTARLKSV